MSDSDGSIRTEKITIWLGYYHFEKAEIEARLCWRKKAKLFLVMKVKLTDEHWEKILPILKSFPKIRLGVGRDVRQFLEVML
jgi:hypothetical protein